MRLLFCLFLILVTAAAYGQVRARAGLRLGLATSDVTTGEVNFSNNGRDFSLALDDARYTIHGGLFLQVKVNKFFVQPEVLFTSTRNDYRFKEITSTGIIESIRKENFQNIDVPLMLGFKWGPLRLQAGPVGHVYVSSSSELFGLADYQEDFEEFTVGYQAGVGLDLWNVLLDFKYQSSFQDVGSHLTFGGERVAFDTNPSQLVMSVGLSFN